MGQASAGALAVPEKYPCEGGRSYGCKKMDPHVSAVHYLCHRCGTKLGCKLCAMIPVELVCMVCRDVATPRAVKRHGTIVHDRDLGTEALRIVSMIFKGSVTQEDGEKLISELFHPPASHMREL